MTHIAGLAGNRGRNLLNIADRAPAGTEFSVILTNTEGAPVLTSAAERGIPTEVVEQRADESRESHERRVLDRLSSYDVDLVCLDGYMRVLTNEFLDAAPLTLNVHPALLPSFKGMDAWNDALSAGVKVTGCTVHVVTEEVDGGPIVAQEPVPVYEDDTEADLKDRVLHEGEFVAYPRAVKAVAEDRVSVDDGSVSIEGDESGKFPARRFTTGDRTASLRYGENPHQDAALYADVIREASVVHANQLNESAKGLSYNNYNDADGALNLIKEFEEPAAAVIKHTNPAGCATAETLADAYAEALATDPQSAYGGIVALNRECDTETAEQIIDSFKEIVVAPGYTDSALDVLRSKENLRILDTASEWGDRTESLTEKSLVGGRLVQERDRQQVTRADLEFVTEKEPTDEQIESMLFGWKVIKHVKSNAIVFTKGTETVGVGMGQVSRVDAVRLAGMKADEHAEGKSANGAVMVSDAFFPFPDGIERAAENDIEAVIQPGGSVNDDDVIDAANELGIAMAFTGQRCFKHD